MAAYVLSTEKRKQLYCCSPNMKTTKNIKRIVFNQVSVNVYSTEQFDNEYSRLVYMLIQKNGTMSAEEIIAKCDEVNATKEMQVRDGVAAIKKLHVVTATKELHDEENVAKQVE